MVGKRSWFYAWLLRPIPWPHSQVQSLPVPLSLSRAGPEILSRGKDRTRAGPLTATCSSIAAGQ